MTEIRADALAVGMTLFEDGEAYEIIEVGTHGDTILVSAEDDGEDVHETTFDRDEAVTIVDTFQVEVQRTVACTVDVKAGTAQKALDQVKLASFVLPPLEQWDSLDGWEYVVYAEEEELLRQTP